MRPLLLMLLSCVVLATAGCSARGPARAQASCRTTVPPGGDVAAAVFSAGSGATVCLAPGIHSPFALVRAPAGVTVFGEGQAIIAPAGSNDGVVVMDTERLTVQGVTITGRAGFYAARAPALTLRNVRVEGAALAVQIDDGSSASLDNVTIDRPAEIGLAVRRGASLTGERVRVLDSGDLGVIAVDGPGPLTLRESEIARAGGVALFAGVGGCGNLGVATLDVPPCFYDNLERYISDARLTLEGVHVHDGPGPGIVLFPGVSAELRGVTVAKQEVTGLFAWGAEVHIHTSLFDDNAEHAIELRSYPDPRGPVTRAATGSIQDSVIRNTRPVPGTTTGGGILLQGATGAITRNEVTGNATAGIVLANGSGGSIIANIVTNNGGAGVCLTPGMRAEVRDNLLAGNGSDDLNACGGA